MKVSTALETKTEVVEVMRPGVRTFDDAAIFAKADAIFGTAFGDHRIDTSIAASRVSLASVTMWCLEPVLAQFLACPNGTDRR